MAASPSPMQVIDTELYADSVEWCPYTGLQDVLLCGTYQLLESSEQQTTQEQPQVRVGQLQVFNLHHQGSGNFSLSQTHCVSMPGILDIKWARQPVHELAVFGLVNAKGQLQVWKMGECSARKAAETVEGKMSPESLATVEISDCIGLSLDWDAPNEGSVPKIVTSDSTGQLSVFEVSSTVSLISQWHAHDFEAWICAFDQWRTDMIYSGSDDCKLKVWDLRVGSTPVSTNKRFTMGVCSIQSSPLREHLLAVGSYDENLRVFDTRKMQQPVSMTPLGGGVWRVKWDPFSANHLLTATMHNGFHIVDCSKPDAEPLPVKFHYTHHKSLAYGADWCRLNPSKLAEDSSTDMSLLDDEAVHRAQPLIASCSFYDHSLQLWQGS